MSISLRNVFCVAAILLTGATAPPAVADIVIPDELQGQYGAQYHLVFVTSTLYQTTDNTDIAYYNDLVTAAANNGTITGDWGISWRIIGSTRNSPANTNTNISAPVYLLNGTTKVATGYDDMWDGSLLAPINLSENNINPTPGTSVLTGSYANGDIYQGKELGTGSVRVGQYPATNSAWISIGESTSGTPSYRYYAISELLTVPVPEPSSIAIWLGLAGIGLLVGIRRRQGASR